MTRVPCNGLGYSDGPLSGPKDPHILLVHLKGYDDGRGRQWCKRLMMHSRLFGCGDKLSIRCIHFYKRDTRLVVLWHFYDPVREKWRKKKIIDDILTASKWNWTWTHKLKYESNNKQQFVFKFRDAETKERVSSKISYSFQTGPPAFL